MPPLPDAEGIVKVPTMAPTRPKVKAAGAGAGAGGLIGTLLIWILGASVWGKGWAADQVDNAIAAVPGPLVAVIAVGIPWLVSWASGYITTDPPLTHLIEGTNVLVEHEGGNGGDHRA